MRIVLIFGALILLSSCAKTRDYSSPSPLEVSNGAVELKEGTKFLDQIRIATVEAAPGGERKLRTVAQMVAMANSSGGLLEKGVSWVTLDSDLIHELGVHLPSTAPVGYAYGVTTLGAGYVGQVHPGEKVEIYRYGLRQNSTEGSVVSVHKSDEDETTVIFGILHGLDWYPGTNCEVEFPLIHRQAVAISPISMLHEGLREYVLKEIAPHRYAPSEITVVNETPDQVFALGALNPGDRIIGSGAILLKPIVHEILAANKEGAHVR